MLWQQVNQTVELGWDFYLPVLMFIVLIAMAVPVWAAIGAAATTMEQQASHAPQHPGFVAAATAADTFYG